MNIPNVNRHHDFNINIPNLNAHQDFLNLSLSPPYYQETVVGLPLDTAQASSSSLPPPQPPNYSETVLGPPPKRPVGRRPSNRIRPDKAEDIPPPYQWATKRRATIHSLQYLQSKGINTITGSVQCKKCGRQFDFDYDLHKKFIEVANFINENQEKMRHRAPAEWMNPTLPDCKFCGHTNCMKPVHSKKKKINWLFLFLGQMVGCCKLSELKYFCKHTKKHRTGAKDRVLYLTYLELCRQLRRQESPEKSCYN